MTKLAFKKVKVDKSNRPTLIYDRVLPNHLLEEGVTLNGTEPSEEVAEALNGFVELAISMMDLGSSWKHNSFVSGVSMKSEGEGSDYGITITLQQKFEDGYAAVVNTPFIKVEMQTQSDAMAIQKLVRVAEDYINQRPRQGSLLEEAIAGNGQRNHSSTWHLPVRLGRLFCSRLHREQ